MASEPTPLSAKLSLRAFTASLGGGAPPDGLDNALQALWYEARAGGPGATPAAGADGDMPADWKTAHGLVQRQRDERGRWVHGYLHRIEGDDDNAAGWYERAGRPFPTLSFADEWTQIAADLLAR
jgi:hypothetical protein